MPILADMARLGGCRRYCGDDIDGLVHDLQITARLSLSTVKTGSISSLLSFTLLARLGVATGSRLRVALGRAGWVGTAVAVVCSSLIHRFVTQCNAQWSAVGGEPTDGNWRVLKGRMATEQAEQSSLPRPQMEAQTLDVDLARDAKITRRLPANLK